MPKEKTSKSVAKVAGKLLGHDIDKAINDLRHAQDLIDGAVKVLRLCKKPVASAVTQREK